MRCWLSIVCRPNLASLENVNAERHLPDSFLLLLLMLLLPLPLLPHYYHTTTTNKKKTCFSRLSRKIVAPGGARTPDLRITSALSAIHASTAYKYDALTDCATGAG